MGSWGEQFSCGDQGSDREKFYENGRRECPRCGGQDITMECHVAGCRHNGDGYGTEVFTCKSCQWSTSFQYDEAGDTYYYEFARRRDPPPVPAPRSYRVLTKEDEETFEKSKRLMTDHQLRSMMVIKGYDPVVINDFLTKPTPPARGQSPPVNRKWTKALVDKYKRVVKVLPKEHALINLKEEGFNDRAIQAFLKAINISNPSAQQAALDALVS